MKKTLAFILIALMLCAMLAGCMSQAKRVSYNVSKEADQFNVQRRVTVINTRTDKPMLEVIGLLSVQYSSGDIDIIMEVAPNVYKKHFVGLNEWTTYIVEDISGAYVDKYHYEINFLPEMIVPITVTSND
jgi:hypothetical protein